MSIGIIQELLLPFFGTALGAACVFVMRGALHAAVQRALTGFAAGFTVMLELDAALG